MNKKTLLCAGGAVFCWSTMAPVAKVMLSGLPDFEYLGITSLIAALAMAVIYLGDRQTPARNLRSYHRLTVTPLSAGVLLRFSCLGMIGMFLYTACYNRGIVLIGSQNACIINYLWPTFIVIFSCLLLHEQFTVKKGIALALSFSGVVVMTLGQGAGSGSGDFLPGVLCSFLAAVFYGLFAVLNRRWSRNQNLCMLLYWAVCAAASCICSLLLETPVLPTLPLLLGLAWNGIMVSAMANYLWALALQSARESAKIANLAYLVPFLSMVLSILFLGEPFHIISLLALLLIVGGILVQSV